MKHRRVGFSLAICALLFVTPGWLRAGDDVQPLLQLVPGDLPITAVVVNFEKLDASILALTKRLDPESTESGILAELKTALPITKWVDFSKPFAMVQTAIGDDNSAALWAYAPEFVNKVKEAEGAAETDGVWRVPFGSEELYVRFLNPYIIASQNKETIARVAKPTTTLSDALKGRPGALDGRDALLRINADPIRPMAQGGLAQAAAMAPMLAMMAGQQQPGSAAALTGGVTAMVDAAGKLVEQLAYIDVAVALENESINATIATGFNAGAIKDYLAKQQPAPTPLLSNVEEQPYFVAGGYHVPGSESPFFEWFFGKMIAAIPPPMPNAHGQPGGAAPVDVRAAMEVSRDLYSRINETGFVMGMSPDGIRMSGDYAGGDARAILELTKKSITLGNAQLGPGATYESIGSKTVAGAEVEEFALKFDTSNPQLAPLAMMLGPNPKIAYGLAGDRVRFYMGGGANMEQAFARSAQQPFASGKQVAPTLAALPNKTNFVLLIDPAGAIPMIGPMMGMPPTTDVPPGPPIGVSVLLAGDPANLHIHVPISAIERMMKAMPKKGPM